MKLCYLDVETTGLDAARHEIWEIALLLEAEADPTVVTSYRWTFRPTGLQDADPNALRINRFYDRTDELPLTHDFARFWLDGTEVDTPLVRNAMWDIAELTAGAHLVGANPAFDALRLERMLAGYGIAAAWHYHLIDVEALTLGFLAGRRRSSAIHGLTEKGQWHSGELANSIGVSPSPDAHSALADADWARRIYRRVMA